MSKTAVTENDVVTSADAVSFLARFLQRALSARDENLLLTFQGDLIALFSHCSPPNHFPPCQHTPPSWNDPCSLACDSMDRSPRAPLSMEFFRQKHWSGLPFPSPGCLLNAGIEPGSLAFQGGSLSSEPTEKLCFHVLAIIKSAVMDMVLFKQ